MHWAISRLNILHLHFISTITIIIISFLNSKVIRCLSSEASASQSDYNKKNRRPLVLYRWPECWGYAELEQSWKYISTQCCISFHPCKSIRKQIWPCHKKWLRSTQGHHMKTLVVLEYPMPYTNFQSHQLLGPEEEGVRSFSPCMSIVMWPGTFEQILFPHIPWRLRM